MNPFFAGILKAIQSLFKQKPMSAIAQKYEQMFNTATLKSEKKAEVDFTLNKLIQEKARYEAVAGAMGNGIPFWFIMLCHAMEAGGFKNPFLYHLHCGDPLTARTVHVPAGRPKANPGGRSEPPSATNPYTWEESALDCMKFLGYDKITDWRIGNALDLFEKFNGLGYRKFHPTVPTPYLWSYTNFYSKGKYVLDGKFDPEAVSKQPGVVAYLLRLKEKQII